MKLATFLDLQLRLGISRWSMVLGSEAADMNIVRLRLRLAAAFCKKIVDYGGRKKTWKKVRGIIIFRSIYSSL